MRMAPSTGWAANACMSAANGSGPTACRNWWPHSKRTHWICCRYSDIGTSSCGTALSTVRIRPGGLPSTAAPSVVSLESALMGAQSPANGVLVQLWDCNGVAQQNWTFSNDGSILGFGGKCLDVGNNGADVELWDCGDERGHQPWAWDGINAGDPRNDIMPGVGNLGDVRGFGGKCLVSDDARVVHLGNCGDASRPWWLGSTQPLPTGGSDWSEVDWLAQLIGFTGVQYSSWWCLNEYPSTGAVTLEECAQRNDTGHFWHFAGDGTVRVDNSNWGWMNPMLVDRCLVVNATRPVNGAPVMTTSCRTLTHYPLNQHFAVYSDLTIRPLPSKCLTVPGGRADNGTVIQLSDCNSSPQGRQLWSAGADGIIRSSGGLPGSARREPSQRRCGGPGHLQQQFGPQPALDDTVTKRTRRKSIAGCSACHESFIFVLLQVRSSDRAAHFAFSCDVRSQPRTAAHPPKAGTLHHKPNDRGRNENCFSPPAQIRTGPIKAFGSYLGCLAAKRTAGQG